MEKKLIEIFVSVKEQSSEGCGCSCSCGSADTITPTKLSEYLRDGDCGKNIDVRIIEVEKENRDELITRFNDIFENSGEKLTVKDSSLDFTLSRILPLVVESGKIRSAKELPNKETLCEAINSDGRVKIKSGCC